MNADAKLGAARVPAPATDDRKDAAAAKHTLRGRVIQPGGEPVTTFRVEVVKLIEGGRSLMAAGDFQDPDGRFELAGVPAGEWKLIASSDEHPLPGLGEAVIPGTQDVELVLAQPGTLEGVVLDPYGAPAAQARLVVFGRGDRALDHGHFSIPTHSAAPITLHAAAPGFGPSEPATVTVPWGQTARIELILTPESILRGVVLDAQGAPEPEAVVRLNFFDNRHDTNRLEKTTDDRGHFEFRGLASGKYLAMVEEAERPLSGAQALRVEQLELAAGQTSEITLGGARKAGIELTLVATYGGRPVPDDEVVLLKEGEDFLSSASQARFDERGTATFSLPTGGRYAVLMTIDGGREARQITVPDLANCEVHLDFPSPAQLSGRLVGIETADSNYGGAMIQLHLEDSIDSLTAFASLGKVASAANDGEFHFTVPPGHYTLTAPGAHPVRGIELASGQVLEGLELRLEGYGSVVGRVVDAYHGLTPGRYTFVASESGRTSGESALVDVKRLAMDPVEFEQTDPSIELALAPGAMLELSLSEAAGTPLQLATYRLFDVFDRPWHGMNSERDRMRVMSSGFHRGRLTTGPIPPGPYRIEAHAADGRIARGRWDLAPGQNKVELVP